MIWSPHGGFHSSPYWLIVEWLDRSTRHLHIPMASCMIATLENLAHIWMVFHLNKYLKLNIKFIKPCFLSFTWWFRHKNFINNRPWPNDYSLKIQRIWSSLFWNIKHQRLLWHHFTSSWYPIIYRPMERSTTIFNCWNFCFTIITQWWAIVDLATQNGPLFHKIFKIFVIIN